MYERKETVIGRGKCKTKTLINKKRFLLISVFVLHFPLPITVFFLSYIVVSFHFLTDDVMSS